MLEGPVPRGAPRLVGVAIAACVGFCGPAPPASAWASPADGDALDIPGHGRFVSIEISMTTTEGDAQGISLSADGSLRTWDDLVSGFEPQNPERERTTKVPVERVAALAALLAVDGALVRGSGDTGPAQYREVRRVVTSGGTWALRDQGAEAERALRRLRFYIAGAGQLEWVAAPTRYATVRLDVDGVLLATPHDGTRPRAWLIQRWELHVVRDLLERTGPGSPSSAVLQTHAGVETVRDGGVVERYLGALLERQLGLELDGDSRFQEVRLSVECHGALWYLIRIDADGEVTAVAGDPARSPFTLPGGRAELRVSPAVVYGLVRFLATPEVQALARSETLVRTPLDEGAQLEITLIASARTGRSIAGIPVPVDAYDAGFFGASRYVVDPERAVEARLVRLVTDALAR